MRKLCAVLLLTTAVSAETKPVVETQFGRLKTDIAPSADFGIAIYRHGAFRIGAYSAPTAQGIIASYDGDAGPFRINLGQREKSVEQGFLISNGAYLPWTRNFAYAEASGVALETNTKWVSADALYYQQQQNNLFMSRLKLTPLSWFRLQGGIAVPELQQSQTMLPVGAVVFGKSEESAGKFYASLEAAGRGNYLTSVQYADGWLLRALAFRRNEINPLASGIYENSQGLAAQFISDFWFLQFFSAQTTYGLARYAGTYLTAIAVYEEKIQLAGFSLRNNPDGFHVRSGLTFGSDSSMQSLFGLGYADYVFLGGGHFQATAEQPLEPVIFPSEWYNSVLLQSTSMRIRDNGFKMLFLVNTEVVKGFVAVTYAEDFRQREKMGFFMRVSGRMLF